MKTGLGHVILSAAKDLKAFVDLYGPAERTGTRHCPYSIPSFPVSVVNVHQGKCLVPVRLTHRPVILARQTGTRHFPYRFPRNDADPNSYKPS